MSNQQNTQLLELAAEHISYWEGEGIGQLLENDVDRQDYEALTEHIKLSANMMFIEEYAPDTTFIDVNYIADSMTVEVRRSKLPKVISKFQRYIERTL